MKTLFSIVALIFIAMAALATPVAIGFGIYDWVIVDMEFKFALWYGFKMWISMIAAGLVVGVPSYIYSNN